MLRILRAFAWLRWRILLNSLERSGSRDALARFSGAVEQLAPAIVMLVMLPSALILAAAGVYTGWELARGEPHVVSFDLLRVVLIGGCVLALVGPLLLPRGEGTHAVRLLLLPVPRSTLYLGQSMSALADPWMLLSAAVVASIPLGMAAGGAPAGGALSAIAGLLLLAALAGLALAMTGAIHLAARDRRRGELLALLLMLAIPVVAISPGVLDNGSRQRRTTSASGESSSPSRSGTIARVAVAMVPSEIYARATRAAAQAGAGTVMPPLLGLAAMAAILHAFAFTVFARVLTSPGVTSSRRSGPGALAGWRVPGMTPAASAVALNQVKLALRTPRGRSTLLSPLVVFLMLAVLLLQSPSGMEFAFIRLQSGAGLAAFTSFVSLLSILPLAMNQFAIDGPGLTMTLLAPIETRALLAGKAIGNGLVAAIPASLCMAAALALFPGGDPALWLSVPLALAAAYLVGAPVAAALSAVFPRAVDMNSIGSGSNAHGAAGLLGMLAFLAAGVPSLLLVTLATTVLERPRLAPVLLLAWCGSSAALSLVLFRAARAIFDRRRESLAMLA